MPSLLLDATSIVSPNVDVRSDLKSHKCPKAVCTRQAGGKTLRHFSVCWFNEFTKYFFLCH